METPLIQKAINGDKEAFAAIILSRKAYLFKIAYKYTKNKEDALEIVGETVYRAFISVQKLKEPAYFNTWLTRILINVANDFCKKNPNLAELNSLSLSISSNVDERITELDLQEAIKELPDQYRDVICLRFFHDLKIKEISNILQRPESTIKTHLSRALNRLKMNLLGQNGGIVHEKPIK